MVYEESQNGGKLNFFFLNDFNAVQRRNSVSYRLYLKLLLETHHLQNITDHSLELSSSIDGNIITKSYHYITTGFEIIDLGIICPIAYKILNLNIYVHNTNNNILTQS